MANLIDNNLLKAEAAYTKGRETGIKGQQAGDPFPAGRTDETTGYVYDSRESKERRKLDTADNFADYLETQRERAKEARDDVRSKEEQDKEAEKELRNNLSSEEIKKLKMMGIDIEGATLSDLMGVINTMRGNAHRENTAQMFAEIKAEGGDVGGLSVVGGSVKVAGTDINVDISVTDLVMEKEAPKEETEGKNEKAEPMFDISNDQLVYLLKNDLNASKENLYKAHYSGSRNEKNGASGELVLSMKQQIDKVIEQAGYAPADESYKAAEFLMDNNLMVTADSVKKYMEFQNFVGQPVKYAALPDTAEEKVEAEAKSLYEKANSIADEAVYELAEEGREITIAAAYSRTVAKQFKRDNSFDASSLQSEKAVTAIRQMEEIRLSMTMSMAGKLAKMNINIDTKELSRVVDALKQIENKMIEEKLGTAATPENVELYKSVNEHIELLADRHMAVLGTPLKGTEFTVRGLYEVGEALENEGVGENAGEALENALESPESAEAYERVRRSPESSEAFEKARRSYEAVGTAPRSDMGDSITKAFSNVDDILKDLGFEVNIETQRAVKILGYNQLEITPENVNQVMNYDRQVNELMDTFYPEAVLGAIKDGINPLDVPIDELVDMVRAHNYNEGVTEAENFATYLMDVEKQGNITPKERESYIGIYRAMNKLAKSRDREAGWIFANGERLTVRNLVSAMRSRRAAEMDFEIDDSFGELSYGGLSNSITDQIESAFTSIDRFNSLDDEVSRYIEENHIEYSMTNAFYVDTMLNTQGGIYQMVLDVLGKMKFSTNIKDELIDEETENMSDSLLGEEIENALSMENILEQIEENADVSLTYEDIRNRITELMYDAGAAGIISAADISAIKLVNAGLNIASRMAKNDRYQIPVDTEAGVKLMNLTIRSGEEGRGGINISINDSAVGSIRADVYLVDEATISGYIESSTSEGSEALSQVAAYFNESMKAFGFDAEGVSVGTGILKSRTAPDRYNGDGRVMYKAAVAMVKSIGNILK